jgi:hypothetical protein
MQMTTQLARDSLGWGFVLWLVGYVMGIGLFFVVPPSQIGWVILPVGVLITVWVLLKKVHGDSLPYYIMVAVIWTAIAVVFDYVFIVKAFEPADGYYKLDVYLYYALTCALPLAAARWKRVGLAARIRQL